MRVLAAQINPTIGDFEGNTEKILRSIQIAKDRQADLVLFSELTITGYPPGDFLLHDDFIHEGYRALRRIEGASAGISVVVGLPTFNKNGGEKHLCDSAAIITDGKVFGIQDKTLLPTYDVFDERRYFEPSSQHCKVWPLCGQRVGITICEDVWQHSAHVRWASYARDPVLELQSQSPDIVLNLSASPYSVGKLSLRLDVFGRAAKTLACPVIYCNQVGGNDSLIFDGYSCMIAPNGQVSACAAGFEEDYALFDTCVQAACPPTLLEPVESLYRALVLGVRDYFHKNGFDRACLGLSGGIDSALVACIAVEALGSQNVLGVAMPSRYSSPGSLSDATALANNLGIELRNIPIEGPHTAFLSLLEPHFQGRPADVTEENLQARLRGVILMALSNKQGYILLSTGNKSELAMGYSTLYGDMAGGLSVINDVTKMQVYALAHWINRNKKIIPQDTISKAPSAELRPNQKDSDSLPSYEILDNVLNAYVERLETPEEISKAYHYPIELVQDLIRRLHRNEYKRRQSAPGLRVTEKAFFIGRQFPIVQKWR